MDELMTVFVAQAQAQAASAFALLSEIRFTRALVYFAIGLFALANNWAVIGVPAFVLAAVAVYLAVSAHRRAEDAVWRHREAVKK